MMLGPALGAARGTGAGFGSVTAGLKRLPSLLVVHLVLLVASIVPSFNLLPCMLCLAPFFVVDQKMGPIQALRASWRAASDNLGGLWIFHVAMVPLMLSGIVVGGVGLFISVAIYYVGIAYEESSLRFSYLFPSFPSWQDGEDRSVVCFVVSTDAPLTTSVKGLAR